MQLSCAFEKIIFYYLVALLECLTQYEFVWFSETNLGQTFLLKYPKVIIMVSVFTRPRVRTHHSRVSVEMMYWMVQRLLKSKTLKNLLLDGVLGTHLIWHLALRTQTLHILIFLQSLRSLVLLSLRVTTIPLSWYCLRLNKSYTTDICMLWICSCRWWSIARYRRASNHRWSFSWTRTSSKWVPHQWYHHL